MKKRFISALLLPLLLCASVSVYALDGQPEKPARSLYVLEDASLPAETADCLLLWSNVEIKASDGSGAVFLFFSNLKVSRDFSGDIYALFSLVKVEEGARFSGTIYSLSSDILVLSDAAPPLPIFGVFRVFSEMTAFSRGYSYSDKLPGYAAPSLFILFVLAFCAISHAAKRSVIIQGAEAVRREWKSVLKMGAVASSVAVGFVLATLASVLLIPVSLLFALAAALCVIFGEASLALWLGSGVFRLMNIRPGSFLAMVAGLALIELAALIPVAGGVIRFAILPIFSLGSLCVVFINGVFRHKFYESELEAYDEYSRN